MNIKNLKALEILINLKCKLNETIMPDDIPYCKNINKEVNKLQSRATYNLLIIIDELAVSLCKTKH